MNRRQKLSLLLKNIVMPDFLIEKGKTFYGQDIEVRRSMGLGVYISVGGLTQSGWVVETIWRETLNHLSAKKIASISSDTKCLVLGLGGGSLLKVLAKRRVHIIDAVDIDPAIVSMGKRYLFQPLADTSIKITDAYKYAKNLVGRKKKYDLVLVDLYQGKNIPQLFGSSVFMQMLVKLIKDNGVVIVNRLYSSNDRKESVKFGRMMEKYFMVDWFYPRANLMLIGKKEE